MDEEKLNLGQNHQSKRKKKNTQERIKEPKSVSENFNQSLRN